MGVGHKLLPQLFLIGFCLFYRKNWKKIGIKISCNLRLLLRLSAGFSYTSRQSSANPHLHLVDFKEFNQILFSNPKHH